MTSLADTPVNGTVEGTQPRPAVLSSAPSAAALLTALRRRWLLASSAGLFCAAAAAISAWLLVPTRYSARALLDVAANPPKVIFNTNENRTEPFHTYQKKQIALVKSRLVLATALRQPKVGELDVVRRQLEPVEWLENQLQADYSVAPEILRVALNGDKPEELVILVDAITDAFLQEVVNKEHKRRLERLDQLKELYNSYDDNLRRKRQTLRDLAQSAGSADSKTLALKHRFAIEQLAMAEKELMDLQSQSRKLQVEAADEASKQKVAEPAVSEAAIDERMKADTVMQGHLSQMSELEQQIDLLKRRAVDPQKVPAYTQSLAALASTKAALAA